MLTQEQLKEVLHYNSETGLFTWVKRSAHRIQIGDIAGALTVQGYIRIKVKLNSYPAHRLAWLYMHGAWPKDMIDHINHITNDNRWVNLRETTQSENIRNSSLRENSASGVTGVTWNKRDCRWVALIRINAKLINLGSFTDRFEAICRRKSANIEYGFHLNHGIPRPPLK